MIDHLLRILEIDSELNKLQDLDILLDRLLLIARKESNADAGTVYLRTEDKLAFSHTQNDTLQSRLGPGQKLPYNYFTIPINDESISGFVAGNKTALNIENMYAIDKSKSYKFDPRFDKVVKYKTISSLTFPLVDIGGVVLGVMQLINARNKDGEFVPFNEEDVPFFEVFARFGTKAIQRASRTRSLLETISRFSGLRDPVETSHHVNRVGAYSILIYEYWARQHNMNQEDIDKNIDVLRMAAMLHDVGKVAISDLILKKPGKLTEEEFRIMKSHTWVGAAQFTDNSDLSYAARDVALHHHENWDGSGYPGKIDDFKEADQYIKGDCPAGLEGENIPLFARIVSLCDVYDALCSKRSYKNGWPEEKVLSTIRKNAGKKFDPELVECFWGVLPNLKAIQQRYPL